MDGIGLCKEERRKRAESAKRCLPYLSSRLGLTRNGADDVVEGQTTQTELASTGLLLTPAGRLHLFFFCSFVVDCYVEVKESGSGYEYCSCTFTIETSFVDSM